MVVTVRTRSLSMKDLCEEDRSWIVAALTVQGWTAVAIADRLRCSLRLVQTIKTEPMTLMARYAWEQAAALAKEQAERAGEQRSHAAQALGWEAERARLCAQRDALLEALAAARRIGPDGTLEPIPHPRRAAWTRRIGQ